MRLWPGGGPWRQRSEMPVLPVAAKHCCRPLSSSASRTLVLVLLVVFAGPGTRTDLAKQNPSSQPQASAPAADGVIAGTVVGPSGAAVAGAQITLSGSTVANGNASRQKAVSDGKGSFSFEAIEPGTYTLEVAAAGFQKSVRSHLVVESHKRLTADFSLVPEPSLGQASAQPGAPGATGKSTSDSSLRQFSYDDQTEFKPSSVNVSVDPGGYSASKEVDAYRLMLDYVQAEGSSIAAVGPAGTGRDSGQSPASSAARPTEAELDRWSESQFLSRGSSLLLNHDVAASVDTFRAGVARFPESAKLEAALGIALTARGQFDKAIASLLRATDLAPSNPQPYFVLAKAYGGSSASSDEVLKRLRRLATLDPGSAQAHYYYALALSKGSARDASALKQIAAQLQKAVTLDPEFADAHLELGIVYAALSSDAEAIREYQSAIRLKPNLAAAHYRLAQAYMRTGEKSAARSELDTYEKLRKTSADKPQ